MEDDGFWIEVLRVDSVGDTASSHLFFELRDKDTFAITMETWASYAYMRVQQETLMMTADVDAATKMRDWLNEFLAVAGGGSGKEEGEVGGDGNK